MILKGNQRAGGRDLATHLSNEYDNERVEIASVRGSVADDLHGAFAEYEAVAAGTRCRKPLYSLSVNPSAPLSRAQYMAAIDHIEGKLGLTGQPRAVVFHVKDGREHCHVVWSRIDVSTMRAIQISHDHMKLRTCSRELALAYGLTLPAGLAENRGDARFETVQLTHAEKAMAESSGLSPEQRRREITAIYRASGNADAFRLGLEKAGYVMAQGDRRSYVVVDAAGHVHALARQIEGARKKDVVARLADLPADRLPTVAAAQAQQSERRKAQDERAREQARQRGAKSAADLKSKQDARRNKLGLRRQQLELVHRHERLSLSAAHKSDQDKLFNRVAANLFGLFDKVPGLRSVIAPLRRNPAINPTERERIETDALKRRHGRERAGLDRRAAALDSIDTRERRGLIRDLVREARVAERMRQGQIRSRIEEIRGASREVTEREEEGRDAQRARIRQQLATLGTQRDGPDHRRGPRRQ